MAIGVVAIWLPTAGAVLLVLVVVALLIAAVVEEARHHSIGRHCAEPSQRDRRAE
jgi:hypothetical protein